MFKKAISLLLVLALLCSCSLLSVFAEPANDAEAVEQNYHFKVTTADGTVSYGKFTDNDADGTARYTPFKNVPNGATVTVLTDVTVDREVRLDGVYTIDGNGKTLNVRFRTDTSGANVVIQNAKFDVTLSGGYFYQIAAGEIKCEFDNCTFVIAGTPSAGVFIGDGNLTFKNSNLTYNAGSADKPLFFNWKGNSGATIINTPITLSEKAVSGFTFGINDRYYTSTSFNDFNARVTAAPDGAVVRLCKDYTVTDSSALDRFNFRRGNIVFDGNGHTISGNTTSWLIRIEIGKNITIRNLNVKQNGTGSAMQTNGSTAVTLENSTIQCTNTSSAAMVFRGTLILNAGAKILAGHGFYADQGTSSLIVNRGAEINVSGQLYSAQKASDSKTINGGTFTIGGKLLYRDPTAEEVKNSDATLFLPDGGMATIDNSGIRFTTVVDKAWLDEMEAAGAKIVGYGTLIAPKKYVDKAEAFTAEALKDLSFVDIENNGWFNSATAAKEGRYFFYGNLIELQPASITNELSGIGYLVIEVEGLGTFTVYGTRQNGTVSELAAKITGKDAAQNEVLEFFRGNAD